MAMKDETKAARVTLKQVAEAVGVSLATASYALNKGGSLGRGTRDRVLAAAEQLGYRPNLNAQAMRTGRTGAIGMVLPDLANPFFPLLAQTVIHAAREQACNVFLTDTQGSKEAEARSIDALVRRGVDGIVWFPVDDDPNPRMTHPQVPIVVLDRNVDGFDSVLADYSSGGLIAAKHLVDLGHRRIGIISGPLEVMSSRVRADAARLYIEAHAQVSWQVEAAYSADLDGQVVQALIQSKATAVIAGADLIAIGAIRALQSAGKRVPEDVSVIGFDNIVGSEWCTPALTTIDMPVIEIGNEAVALLMQRINAPGDPRRRIIFDVALVERASACLCGDPVPAAKARRV